MGVISGRVVTRGRQLTQRGRGHGEDHLTALGRRARGVHAAPIDGVRAIENGEEVDSRSIMVIVWGRRGHYCA